jgi:casein kinase I family protein HRR25
MDNDPLNSYQAQNEDTMIGKLIFDRYKLIKRLGSGSFGSIYSAEYNNQYYAIKLEEKNKGQNLLENEAYIMSYLHGPGLPYVKSYGYSSKYNILVMELMGKSLEDIFESFVVKKMSPRCVCNIGYQMIEILEFIHNKHVIHRDIKPDNFVVGLNEKRKYVYILDFGLSKKYRSSRTLQHYQKVKNKNLTGTARYASINALNGLTQSRRDDLEAIGYVLMYFLRGRLPWQGIPVKNKEDRYRKIMEKKIATSAEELCRGFPSEFTEYVNYTRNLEYEQDPDYNFLKNLFLEVLGRDGFRIDCYYDWDKETINYFRDFKNVDKHNNNNFNKNKTESSSINLSHQYNNMRDINSLTSTGDNRNNYDKDNLLYNNSSKNNRLLNNTGNNNLEIHYNGTGVKEKKKEPQSLYANETVREYINNEQKRGNQNNLNEKENINNNNILYNNYNNNNNLLDEKPNINQKGDYSNDNEKDNNQNKCFNPRQEKDNKCCLIF